MSLIEFLKRFFITHQCELVFEDKYFHVKLTPEIDKAILNRPFYWHYMEQTKREGIPKTLSFALSPSDSTNCSRYPQLGDPIVENILRFTQNHVQFARLYEQINTVHHTALYPWLVVNLQVHFRGSLHKSEVFSLGVHLITGQIKTQMMDALSLYSLDLDPLDYCFTMSPSIQISRGFQKIEDILTQFILKTEQAWKNQTINQFKSKIHALDLRIQNQDTRNKNNYHQEKIALTARFEPQIYIEYFSAALVYLKSYPAT